MKTKTSTFALLCGLAPFASAATLTGLWEFENSANLGEATIGNDLVITGTAPGHSASLADDHGLSQSGVITSVLGSNDRISASHGIAPNGGGSFVNQYTIVTDIFSPAASRDSWRTIYQTNSSNSNDGEYFIRNSNDTLGKNAIGYSTAAIDETAWTRLVISVDLTKDGDEIISYLDGAAVFTHPNSLSLDGTYSLDPSLFFFTDENGDDAPLHVGALAIYDGVLTPTEVAVLGGAGNAITTIPEPSSLGLLALCGLAVTGRRSRK